MRPACAAITRPRPRRSGAPELMDRRDQEAYDQFGDVSTTPIWDLMIGLSTVATVLGGGLAGVWAVGYLSVGRASLAWPLLGTLAVLVAVNVALRAARTAARHRG